MQPPAHGKTLDSGQKPQKQRLAESIAVGVVSGTRDYTERPFSRPEIFLVFFGVGSSVLDVQLSQRFSVTFKDKGAARFLEGVKGAAPFAEK